MEWMATYGYSQAPKPVEKSRITMSNLQRIQFYQLNVYKFPFFLHGSLLYPHYYYGYNSLLLILVGQEEDFQWILTVPRYFVLVLWMDKPSCTSW